MGYWEHRKEVACDEEKQQNGAEDAERLDGIYYGVPGGGAYDERFGVLCAAGEPVSYTHLDRLVLTLFYLNDMPVKQIARTLDVSENTVRTRLTRGRARFREAYLRKENEV